MPANAIARWRALLGADAVVVDRAGCDPWGLRTFGRPVRVSACLKPRTAPEVASALAIATEHRVPVHPVSRGANWGMGSRAPTVDGGVILDLSGLDRISDCDDAQGLVRVQPGVTFQALADFLGDRGSRFFSPEIGGSVQASVLANALDRGDGVMGDRWSSLGDLEIALPDGELFCTGYAGLGAGRLAGMAPPPAGAMVEGLFSQSNLGVVTAATLRLEAMPTDLAAMTVAIGGIAELPEFMRVWCDCQLEQSMPARSMTLWNGIKLLARESVRHAVPAERIAAAGTGEWYASALIRAESPDVLRARAERLAARFRAVTRNAEFAIVRTDGVWAEGCESLLGVPDGRNLRTVYWHRPAHPELADMDPDRDGCGLIWLCLAFPFDAAALIDFLQWAERRLGSVGIDLNVGIEASSFRCLLSYFTIGYDRNRPGADAAALDAYGALFEEALDRGLAPYRLANGAPVPDRLASSPLAGYLARIRAVGDPAGVLSPGRVGIGTPTTAQRPLES